MSNSITSHESIRSAQRRCAVVTLLSIPIWNACLMWVFLEEIDNPIGIMLYAVLLVPSSLLSVLANSYLIAPLLSLWGERSHLQAILIHLMSGIFGAGFLYEFPSLIEKHQLFSWTIIPYNLAILICVPMLLGSVVYSLRQHKKNQN